MSKANLKELELKLDYHFQDFNKLKQALIHRSYLNEHPELGLDHNERLEFLGDAVLQLLVTEHLFIKYPSRPEGDLTGFRAALVNAETLAALAEELDLNQYLLLSKGEAKDNVGRARQSILADAVEAVIGALYLDGGIAVVRAFVTKYLLSKIDEIVANNLWQDAKSLMQEKSQALKGLTPFYQILEASGPDHDKTFTVGVYLGEEQVALGEGSSKQRAEQEAAREALIKLGWFSS